MADAEITLRAAISGIAREHKLTDHRVDLEKITSDGANYTSQLYQASITSPNQKPLYLFAKVGCFSEKIRVSINADRLFWTEHLIYTELVQIWDKLQDKYQVADEEKYKFPLFYAGDLTVGSETVVLEDLSKKGYGSYDRLKSVDWEHASKSVELLAKFHALSFILEKEDPELYASITKKLEIDQIVENKSNEVVFERMIGSAIQVIDEEHRAKVIEVLKSRGRQMYMDMRRPRGRPVLVHGDYRPSNLLFKRENDNLKTIAIDYQTVHSGCPVTDLIYFLFMGSDEEFRRLHYQDLIEHYYRQLTVALNRYKIDITEVYPREEFDSDFKESLPYALLLGVMILPVVTVEADSAPRTDSDADLGSFIVKPNKLFAERFRGLVNDLMRLGAL